jgi:apolipoprotein N-acyltransferase
MIRSALAPLVRASKLRIMGRVWALLALALLLAACGVADTGVTTAAQAESAAQQAAQARAIQDQVRQQIDTAQEKAAGQRRAAEADGQ